VIALLREPARVSVLSVTDEKPFEHDDACERLAVVLRDRGIAAEGHALRAEDCPIGVTLQERAIELGAQLLAMGGYGHSLVREFVLGGATKDVLNDLRLPVLLSH
jgi:nucleotide-binding universal stress UspA family protein